MIDQEAVIARVVARLAAEGHTLNSLSPDAIAARIDAAARELIAEAPTFPKDPA